MARRAERLARLALLAALSAACGAPVDTSWHDEAPGVRWRALAVPGKGRAGFTPLDERATGLAHRHEVDDEHALANRDLLIGAGAAVGDVDGDGLPDVFLASVERPAALYRNRGGLRFDDVTAASGLGGLTGSVGAAFADVDGDGDVDLLVGTHGGPLMLWRNDGAGRFTDATASSGLQGGLAATTLALADVDGDGDLDLYVATYKVRNVQDAVSPQERSFDQVVKKVGDRYVVVPRWEKEYRVEDRPDLGGVVRTQRAEPDLFYENDGAGRFTPVPIAGARFRDESGAPLAEVPDFFTLAARFHDVNGDGAPDLYVCNDFEDPDQFWLNDGAGNFRLAPRSALAATSNTCMSVAFADVDRDGHVDLFTADMLSPTRELRQRQVPTHTPLPKGIVAPRDREQWMRNMLHVSRGDGTWAEVSMFAGVEATDWTWGSAFADVDLDGWEDLLVANGHRWDVRDADTFQRIRDRFPRVPWNREQGEFPRLAVPNVALRNRGDLTFEDASAAWRFGDAPDMAHAIVPADLDGDGDLDVLVTRLGNAPKVYRNESAARRLAVRLPAREGIGAVITVQVASLPTQRHEVDAGGAYLSGGDVSWSFATGADAVATIAVRWRDGRESVVRDARPNRLYEIGAASARDAMPRDTVRVAPLFADASALLGGHAHHETLYDDFRRQPLLPNRLSQLGPGLAWADVDGDARPDLLVGSGRGGRATALVQRGGRFDARPLGSPAQGDLTTLLAIGAAVLAGQSSYEVAAGETAPAAVVSLATGGATASVLPPFGESAVGALAAGDVDGDGSLELFVGSRVRPGLWPLPAPSRLLRRDARGAWVPDAAQDAVLSKLGLVSSAVIADLDGDGRGELVAVGEFTPVRVLRWRDGALRDVTAELGLGETTSRWNGVSVGDFDGDGRLDLVVTSWGRNAPWRATPERPHVLHVGNFLAPTPGLVFAQADTAGGAEYPLESFPRLAFAAPQVRDRFATFTALARASVRDVLGPMAEQAVRIGATTYDHLVLLNRGGRFEAVPLPRAAQLAPSSGAVVADFDGDGREDLFLSQNVHPTNIELPRLDAGTGLVLLGNGDGTFRPMDVSATGATIRGDMRGAATADYDGDGRADLAVGRNAAATVLWRNVGGAPGVTVQLRGPASNPDGVGAVVRLCDATACGPARAITLGGGAWSADAPWPVLAWREGAREIEVRFAGKVRRVALTAARGAVQLITVD